MNRNSIHRTRPSSRHTGGAILLLAGLAMLVFCVASVRASVANNDPCFTLTTAVSPQEGGEIAITPSPNCQGQDYSEDTEVKLTASPNAGFTFVKWSVNDDDTSDEKVLSLKMDANKEVTATFEAIPPTCYILSRTHTGNGGDPATNPANSADCPDGQYTAGQSIAVTASPAAGWQVAGWSGTTDDSSTATDNTVTMPASGHTVNVTYEKAQHLIFLPVVFIPEWYQIDPTPVSNLYTFIACPTDQRRYAGATDALYEWKSGGWSAMAGARTDVRDFLFAAGETANCQDLYAASFGGGVWRLDGQTWEQVGANNLPFARTLALRDGKLYVGSGSGVFRYDPANPEDWKRVSDETDNVTRLSKAGDRLYAAVFSKGVKYNDPDMCDADSCQWQSIGEPDFKSAFDVAGDEKGSWVVMATAAGIYRWNETKNKWLPPTTPPQPSGTVFALAEVHGRLFAGVQLGGVWVSNDHGDTWAFINELDALKNKTVIDLIFIPKSGLYAVTPDNGVWRGPIR